MFFHVMRAPNVARYGGEIHLQYDRGNVKFLVRYSCGMDRICLLQWDDSYSVGGSYSPTAARDRDAAEIEQVLRDADDLASRKGYNPWVSIRKAFSETLADRVSDSVRRQQQVAKRLPRGARRQAQQ